jgi:hypothetical protein
MSPASLSLFIQYVGRTVFISGLKNTGAKATASVKIKHCNIYVMRFKRRMYILTINHAKYISKAIIP